MKSILWYLLAALGEIAGCFAFWAWLRMQKSPLWVLPGVASLVVFALTRPHSLQPLASPTPVVRGVAGGEPLDDEPYVAIELPFCLRR